MRLFEPPHRAYCLEAPELAANGPARPRMTDSVGAELPDEIHSLLASAVPADQLGKIVLLATHDEQGFPHVTALSLGEVTAVDIHELRVLVLDGGSAARNAAARPEVTLIIIDSGLCCYVKGRCRLSGERAAPTPLQPFNAIRLDIEIVDVLLDGEVGATITAGPRYARDVGGDVELKHWQSLREVLVR